MTIKQSDLEKNRRLHAEIDHCRMTIRRIRENRKNALRVMRQYQERIETLKSRIVELRDD